MDRFRKLLVIPDLGDYSTAMERVARLSRASGDTPPSVALVHCCKAIPWLPRLALPDAERIEEAMRSRAVSRLEAHADPLRAAGLTVTTRVLSGKPAVEVAHLVAHEGFDLLVKDSPIVEPGPDEATDLQILRTVPCAVWLVRPIRGAREAPQILAAVDPTPEPTGPDPLHLEPHPSPKEIGLDDRILDLGSALARLQGGTLHVVHAWDVPGEEMLRGEALLTSGQVDEYVEATAEAHQDALRTLLARHHEAILAEHVHMIKGSTHEVVDHVVEEFTIDELVMGTVVRTGLPGFFLGNTAEAMLKRVKCSVLAVKPPGFRGAATR